MILREEAEKESMQTDRFSPKHRQGRCLLLVIAIGCIILFLVIGIVAGYFIGRKAVSRCEARLQSTPSQSSHIDLTKIHKNAVDMVSTAQLRDSLK